MPPPPSGLPFNAQPNTKYRASKLQDILGREKEFAKVNPLSCMFNKTASNRIDISSHLAS
jgi:hypothetical protein